MRVIEYAFGEWPDTTILLQKVRRFYKVAGELAIKDGLLFKGSRLVVLEALCLKIPEKLHRGLQGVTKWSARSRKSIWCEWFSVKKSSQDTEILTRRCRICPYHKKTRSATAFDEFYAKLVMGMNCIVDEGGNYLIAIDYYSRFFWAGATGDNDSGGHDRLPRPACTIQSGENSQNT